jgi:hypothetical protein
MLPENLKSISIVLPHGLHEKYLVAESEYERVPLNKNNMFVYARWLF